MMVPYANGDGTSTLLGGIAEWLLVTHSLKTTCRVNIMAVLQEKARWFIRCFILELGSGVPDTPDTFRETNIFQTADWA